MNNIVPFVERDIQDVLNKLINSKSYNSQNIVICGESGTGKTSLVRESIRKIINTSQNDNYIIASINLIDDSITPASFLELLIYTLWNGGVYSEDSMLYIPRKNSINKFLSSKKRYRVMAKILLQAIQSTISLIPTYGASIASFTNGVHNQLTTKIEIDKLDILEKYFSKQCKNNKLILVIDNYQFMIPTMKLLLENCLNCIEKNFCLITIHRSCISDLQKPNCYLNNTSIINVENFSFDDIKFIFEEKYDHSEYIQSICDDCFNKTSGNPKEVDLYIRRNHDKIICREFRVGNAKTLKESLCELPEIQRYLVLLATLFPSGIKIKYIYNFIDKLFITNKNDVEYDLSKLVSLGYVVINSINNNILKPAHDKIGLSINKIESDEDFIEFYYSIEKTLEELVINKSYTSDYIYLLHCLIGVCSIQDLRRNINHLIDLINIKYGSCSYYYIAELVRDNINYPEIIECIPQYTLIQILDACQKSSEFSIGLSIYEQWKTNQKTVETQLDIYAVKFLTQMYDFDQALYLIEKLNITNEILLYKLIILQHKALDDEAKTMVSEIRENTTLHDKWYYLILRNSAHYYNFIEAKNNLNECLAYFNLHGTIFEQATMHNNLSVIELWNGQSTYLDAEKNIEESIKKHLKIQSNEIFEPYCNFSVLYYMQGDYEEAIKHIDMALEEVPGRLELDVIILSLNKLLYELTAYKIEPNIVLEKIYSLYSKPVISKDPWVKFQLEYNLYNLEMHLNGHTEVLYNEYFVTKDSNLTGFEIFTNLSYYQKHIPISLSLSPNWRY